MIKGDFIVENVKDRNQNIDFSLKVANSQVGKQTYNN
jgi:hypothetical protein